MLREHIKEINSTGAKKFVVILLLILLTDVAILLDVPVLRVVFGFLCFTILPGVLILCILKLNKLEIVEKIVLSVGLSVSFLMLFGFLIDQLYFSLGYATPLSTISVVVSFSAAMIILCGIGYKTKTFEKSFIKNWLPNLNLSTAEKAFLIVPIIFPALSIFGMYVMNTTDNNIILMFLLFLIPIYIVFVCIFNQKFPKRLYPVVIFLISISLLLLYSLRSNHIIGADTHSEYYIFQIIAKDLHWHLVRYNPLLDTCLSISLLPTIYQSFLNVNSVYLYKLLYSLLFSITPLVIFVISKRYVDELYAFLASFFFMSQDIFLEATCNPRTSLAIFFFALAIMVLLSEDIAPLKKRILFILFMVSLIVSHYSTAYVFFFIMLLSWLSIEILAKRYTLKKSISLTMVLLFFGIIFLWYSQLTEVAFNEGTRFIQQTFMNLNDLFLMESREARTQAILGEGVVYGNVRAVIPHKIEFVFTWIIFVLIGIGVISMIKGYKKMVEIQGIRHLKPDFLKTKFPIEYLVLTVICAVLLVLTIILPKLSKYDIKREYLMMTVILSVVFVMGCIIISKNLSLAKKFFTKRSTHLRNNGENSSQVRAYLIILLVLIPYFMCITGTMYQIFDMPREITLNSKGVTYDQQYIHDHYMNAKGWSSSSEVVEGRLVNKQKTIGNMTEYLGIFNEKSRIYDNGGSEIWK